MAAVGQAPPPAADPAPPPKRQTSPILHEMGWDGKLPRARAHVAIVVVYHRGDHQVIWPHERTVGAENLIHVMRPGGIR